MADSPIGIFDSGLRRAHRRCGRSSTSCPTSRSRTSATPPARPTARAPSRRPASCALECLDRLVDHGVKVLVIACNTASAAVLHDARERYDVPVVEVIRPAVRRAAAATRNDRVGVISTPGTHQSGAYVDAFAAAPHLDVTSSPCPRFVEFVEAGVTGGPELARRGPRVPRPAARARASTPSSSAAPTTRCSPASSPTSWATASPSSPSAEETAKDVYRVLADADRAAARRPAAARARLHDHRRPRRVPPARDAASSGWAARRPGLRTRPPARGARWARDEAHRRRVLRFLRRAGLTRVVLPRAGRARRTHVEPRCSTSAAAPSGALQRHVDPADLDAVLLSHLHPDHCVDLLGLYVMPQVPPGGPLPEPPARCYGPPGTDERLAADVPRPRGRGDGARVRRPRPSRDAAPLTVGPFTVTPFRVNHPVEAYGFRVEADGRVLAYTRRHRRLPRPRPRCSRAPTSCSPTRAFVDGRDTAPGIHLSGCRAAQAAVDAGGVGG